MKNNQIIIGVAIILGCTILGLFLMFTFSDNAKEKPVKTNEYKYEMIRANDDNVIIFNKETGEYWRKFLPNNEGPTDWSKEKSPITSK
ncbi:hypothetical protein [Gottfriedia acidiceleris]|uniref:hypothetical protein n=1 Tax=Gottfriedia acidiceleris TaxID=371036 RepID=UPI00101C59D1|nr:hypothetical protein [Gottfriedia acidiceleris]